MASIYSLSTSIQEKNIMKLGSFLLLPTNIVPLIKPKQPNTAVKVIDQPTDTFERAKSLNSQAFTPPRNNAVGTP
jgi:hypothetical protein